MNVAIICTSLGGGGTERVVSSFANFLATEHSVTIISLTDCEPFYPLDIRIDVRMPEKTGIRFRLTRTLHKLKHFYMNIRQLKPERYFIFGEDIAGPLCLIVKLTQKSKVTILNRGSPRRSLTGLNGILNPLLYRLADSVLVQTKYAKLALQKRYHAINLEVISNQVTVPKFVVPVLDRPKQITYVASLGRRKNQNGLLRIFSTLKNAQDWLLLLAGDGPTRHDLERKAVALGISERVKFLGQVKDIPTLLQSSQIFAFTSLEEGSPNSLAEALAYGCACISYDCPAGPSDLISSGQNGLLINLDDEEMFRSRLDQLIARPSLREEFSISARQRMLKVDPDGFNQTLAETLK